MNMVIPNEGKLLWAEWAFVSQDEVLEDWVVGLFQNDEEVVDASTAADFTLADFDGYEDFDIARGAMGPPALVGNVAVSTLAVPPEYECTGGAPQTVYGWIMWGATSGTLLAGQNFETPRLMSSGATESLDPFAIRLKTYG